MDYKKETIESYNKNAKELSEKFKELMDLNGGYGLRRFIDLLKGIKRLPKQSLIAKSDDAASLRGIETNLAIKVLDLGCGSGDHSLYFKQRGLDATAIDLSEEMVKLCREKGVNAFVKDIENLDFEDKSFDGIWAVTSLLHVPKSKLKSVVQKLGHILKDDGILYVCVKEGEGEGFIKDKFGGTSRFFAFWKEEELMKLFEDYFVVIESKKVRLKNTVFLQVFLRKRT